MRKAGKRHGRRAGSGTAGKLPAFALPACPMRLFLLATLAVLVAGCDGPPDADALLDRVQERFAADMEDVRTLAVTGEGVTAYFRRTDPDSLFLFESRIAPADSLRSPSSDAGLVTSYLPNVIQWVRGLRGNVRLVGERTLSGGTVYVLQAGDVRAFLGIPEDMPDEALRGEIADVAQVFVDAETARVRGLRFESEPDSGRTRPIVQETIYEAFREADGHVLPFAIHHRSEGMDQLIPREQRVVMMGNLTVQRAQAERLPPERRTAALAEIERRTRELQTGEAESTFRVDSVRVNGGIPNGLFALPRAAPEP